MEHIGSALDQFLKNSRLQEGIRCQKLVDAWPEIVGETFAAKSRGARISRNTLWAEAAGSSWAAQLMMVRRDIIEKYRERFGDLPFRDIRVTVGDFPAASPNADVVREGDTDSHEGNIEGSIKWRRMNRREGR
jgi:predicted nucleic acid-binding Zn ribbon protein